MRSIAEEVGVQPRIVSNWRRRFADHGLAGLEDRARGGKTPIYGQATNRRILALLDKPPPAAYARWRGPLLAKALQDVDVQYVWRVLREHNIDLAARKSWCESNDLAFAAKAADVVRLYIDPPGKAVIGKAPPPVADDAGLNTNFLGDRACAAALGRQQHYPRPLRLALGSARGSAARLKHLAYLRLEPNLSCFGNHSNLES